MIDRVEAARALAKAIAYKWCGKDAEAERWAEKLVRILECANILKGEKCECDPTCAECDEPGHSAHEH